MPVIPGKCRQGLPGEARIEPGVWRRIRKFHDQGRSLSGGGSSSSCSEGTSLETEALTPGSRVNWTEAKSLVIQHISGTSSSCLIKTLCMLTSNSSPLPSSPCNHHSTLFESINLTFLYIPHISEIMQHLFFDDWIIILSIIPPDSSVLLKMKIF